MATRSSYSSLLDRREFVSAERFNSPPRVSGGGAYGERSRNPCTDHIARGGRHGTDDHSGQFRSSRLFGPTISSTKHEFGAVVRPPAAMRRVHGPSLGNVSRETSPALFSSTLRAYIHPCRGNPAMAINGRRNKPIGPGGSTRRLHQSPSRTEIGGFRRGRNRIDEGVKGVLLLGMVPPISGQSHSCQ